MLLTYALRRGANGLGIDVNRDAQIVEIVTAGQADTDGVARVGDVIQAIDGVALAGGGMASAMVPGRASYEVQIRRAQPGALETQALAAGLLGNNVDKAERPPVRLVSARARRGPSGLGLDLGHFNRVQSLVPGSPAAEDQTVLPGDVIAGVDGKLVGCGQLPPLLTPGRAAFQFLLMRADAPLVRLAPPVAEPTPPAASAPAAMAATLEPAPPPLPPPLPQQLKPRPLTDQELALVVDGGNTPKEAEPKISAPKGAPMPSPKGCAPPLSDMATQYSPRASSGMATQYSPRASSGLDTATQSSLPSSHLSSPRATGASRLRSRGSTCRRWTAASRARRGGPRRARLRTSSSAAPRALPTRGQSGGRTAGCRPRRCGCSRRRTAAHRRTRSSLPSPCALRSSRPAHSSSARPRRALKK